jgi:peptidoglycan L-alanyl-D-glutamate endopeptidase CwlK
MAVDVMPYPINWNDITRIYYFAGFVKAIAEVLYAQGHITHKVIWGGDWNNDMRFNDNNFDDLPHFELK